MRAQERAKRWFPPRGAWGWVALAALAFLWAAAVADAGLWAARLDGRFSSMASFASHFWPYISLGGAVVGLLARGAPNALRSLPTVWLVLSLALLHGKQMYPRAALPPPAGPTLRVMTFNLGEVRETRPAAIAFLRGRRDVDVLFLQQMHGTAERGDRPRLEALLGGRLPSSAWHHHLRSSGDWYGLGIMSRYALRDVRVIPLPHGPPPRGACHDMVALVAKAQVRGRPVRLATTHLCPPRVPWRNRWLRPVGVSPRGVWDWLVVGIRAFEYTRRSQLIFLRLVADGGVEPFILGGDLNTTPHSLDLLHLSRSLKSAFDERGLGFGFTYHVGVFGARIDHLFYSEGVRARSAAVAGVDVSDHRPLEAVLEILPGGASPRR